MKILSIDTSNQPLSVAVVVDGQLLATTTLTAHKKHAEYLMPVIEDLMQKSDLYPKDLDRIVVAAGPGSYTGIRMGVTVAKTLASTLNIELVTVSSLLTLALNVASENILINPIFDGRNLNMFTGLYRYDAGKYVNVIEDQHTNLNSWIPKLKNYQQKIIVFGEAGPFIDGITQELGDRLLLTSNLNNVPNAAKLALYGEDLAPVKNIDRVVPNYLRLTKAEADWQKNHPNEDTSNYVEKN